MQLKAKVTAVKPKKLAGHINVNPGMLDTSEYKLGDKVTLEVTVEVTSLRKPDMWELKEEGAKPNDVRVGFDMISVKEKGKK